MCAEQWQQAGVCALHTSTHANGFSAIFCCAGHNLESTWLVADTLDYLLSIRAISPAVAKQYRRTVMSIGAAAVRDGFDTQHGGIFESGLPSVGPQSKVKVWWVQVRGFLCGCCSEGGPAWCVGPIPPDSSNAS